MQLVIDGVPYEVKQYPANFPDLPKYEVDNFVGMSGISMVISQNSFNQPEGLILDTIVYVTDEKIIVTASNFETLESVCRHILKAYKSAGWEMLERIVS